MTRLTELEIRIRHGGCVDTECAICHELPFNKVVAHLRTLGMHVLYFEDYEKENNAVATVLEDESTCSRLLSGEAQRSTTTT